MKKAIISLLLLAAGYYYVARIGDIRQEGDRFICDAVLTLEPILKEGQG